MSDYSRKRSYSGGDQRNWKRNKPNDQNNNKLLNYKQYDFEIDWKIKLKDPETFPSKKFLSIIPNIEVEYQRAKKIENLRKVYDSKCRELFDIKAPSESFNRYLFEQLTLSSDSTDIDPFLKCENLITESNVLSQQLLENLPRSLYVSWNKRENKEYILKIIEEYVFVTQKWIQKIEKESNENKNNTLEEFKKYLNEIKQWKNSNMNASIIYSKLEDLKKKTEANLKPFFQLLIEKLCRLIREEVIQTIQYLQKLRQDKKETFTEDQLKNLKIESKGEQVLVKYKEDEIFITPFHYEKLRFLFKLNSGRPEHEFNYFLYILLRRYTSFFGTEENEGKSFHCATPAPVFQILHEQLQVCQENFASPLNCYFKRYNSAFPDIDVFFGSLGSFYDLKPVEGSFETCPPYTLEVMNKMVVTLHNWLSSSDKPLSFVIFVPDWRNPLAEYIALIEGDESTKRPKSPFLRDKCLIEGGSYQYVSGNQHQTTMKDRFFTLPMATNIYILQNDAGFKTYYKEGILNLIKAHLQINKY